MVTEPTVTRAGALVRRIQRLDGDPARFEAVTLGLVDALLERDDATLAAVLDALRDARAQADGNGEVVGWLDAATSFAHWGLERVPSRDAVSRGTQAHDFLSALASASQLGSTELRGLLETDETQVSRTGRRLLEQGLVSRRKVGRQVFWHLTPRGQRALEDARESESAPDVDFWHAALRRGFEAASGDQPGPRREVDPTRERILKSALELHETQGIQATTWPQIAEKAEVPVDMVEAMFPTLDDLVRSCGEHVFESLRMPSYDRAPEVFAGVESENERIRCMTQTFFRAYEHGADGLTAARRERADVPALQEAMVALDQTLDAMVLEAVRPRRADDASVTSIRALTDIEVWRTLRDQGATEDAAVDQASAAVERWLAAHPAR